MDPFQTITLRRPVEFGKNAEPVTELALKPNGGALRDLELQMGAKGELQVFVVKPHELCRVGLRMAGVAGDAKFVDMMDPRDIWEVANAVSGFIMGDQTT